MADVLVEKDFFKPLQELKNDGIMTVSKKTLTHSTKGDFTKFINPNKPEKGGGRFEKGGHSQRNIETLEFLKEKFKNHPKYNSFKKNFEYNIVKTYPNGVRVGNIPLHKEKDKRTGIGQSWFPKDWDDEKIQIAGTYVANLKKNKGKTGFLYGYYDNVKVCIIVEPDSKTIGTIFPDKIQDHMLEGE
jgi:hypothetical protein